MQMFSSKDRKVTNFQLLTENSMHMFISIFIENPTTAGFKSLSRNVVLHRTLFPAWAWIPLDSLSSNLETRSNGLQQTCPSWCV